MRRLIRYFYMKIIIYPRLGTCSRRAFLRTTTRYGRPYYYSPRGDLLVRLSQELGMTKAEVAEQLLQEREFLIARVSTGR